MSAIQVAAALAATWSKVSHSGIDSARALNQWQLRVFLSTGSDSVPRLLADPALAIVDGLASDGSSGEGSLTIPAREGVPVIVFRFPLASDPRDALDRGVDLLVTREPALIDYVAGRPELAISPLPWTRTYFLLQRAGVKPVQVAGTAVERQSFARDAVQADARAAEPLPWWHEAASCPATTSEPSALASNRIAYLRGDEVARGLAERVVALADPGAGLRTIALEPAELTSHLHSGSERAYIMALPRQTLAPCRESAALPQDARIQLLIDTRAHAIVRRGAPPLTVEWDGTLRVAPQ